MVVVPMLSFFRSVLILSLVPALASAATTDNKPKPAPVVPAVPTALTSVAFSVRSEGETRKLVVTAGPALWRIDSPDEGYSLIYDPKTQSYIGLEHRNYTWWQFSWPEVRGVIQSSKRYEARLNELSLQGINSDPASASAGATNGASASVPDDSGYVWKQTSDSKKISGLLCTRWTGDTISGESVEAWCFNGVLPKVQAAMDHLREINEPVSLVPVRVLVPSIVFPVYNALVRGGVTPLLIKWGTREDRNSFGVIDTSTHEVKPDFFTVPKLYMKTTLVTMDGMIDQK